MQSTQTVIVSKPGKSKLAIVREIEQTAVRVKLAGRPKLAITLAVLAYQAAIQETRYSAKNN